LNVKLAGASRNQQALKGLSETLLQTYTGLCVKNSLLLPDFNKIEFSQQIFDKYSNINLLKSSGFFIYRHF
jgi:hypothetical protein